jgi:hypothetical protein
MSYMAAFDKLIHTASDSNSPAAWSRFNIRKLIGDENGTQGWRFICCWEMSFKGDDAAAAQDVVRLGLTKLIEDSSVRHQLFHNVVCPPAADCEGNSFEIMDSASPGHDVRPPLWMCLFSGFAFGVVSSLICTSGVRLA